MGRSLDVVTKAVMNGAMASPKEGQCDEKGLASDGLCDYSALEV